jgi:hypothetical protein
MRVRFSTRSTTKLPSQPTDPSEVAPREMHNPDGAQRGTGSPLSSPASPARSAQCTDRWKLFRRNVPLKFCDPADIDHRHCPVSAPSRLGGGVAAEALQSC